ncbi:hypothetical protein [Lentzea flava]|nr:hypothetical protein [Lentzea flava]
MRVPTENVYPLPAFADPARRSALGVNTIPHGGLLAGRFEA